MHHPSSASDVPGTTLAQTAGVKATIRIAAVGDIHCGRTSQGVLQPLFAQVAECADILLLCGDLVDYGLEEEVTVLLKELAPVKNVPTVAVLGNHDFEAGQPDRVEQLLCDGGVTVLDGDACEIKGVGFAGTKGFGGGFDQRALQPWGEPMMKGFVREAVDEALKLESGLARLRTRQRIALMHYAPIRATVEGEPPEIFPFLGSSRLEEPINRYEVTAVVHGHAHAGTPEGRTSGGVPVYNVSMPLLGRAFPDRPPFRLLEVEVDEAAPARRPAAERLDQPAAR
jgi:Icc-related predicted phosphoesterase